MAEGPLLIGPNADNPLLSDVQRRDGTIVQMPTESVKDLAPLLKQSQEERNALENPGGLSAGPQLAQAPGQDAFAGADAAFATPLPPEEDIPVVAPPTPGVNVADPAAPPAAAQPPDPQIPAPTPQPTAGETAAGVVQDLAAARAAADAVVPEARPRVVGTGAPGKIVTQQKGQEVVFADTPEGRADEARFAELRTLEQDAQKARDKQLARRQKEIGGFADAAVSILERGDDEFDSAQEAALARRADVATLLDANLQQQNDLREKMNKELDPERHFKDQTLGQKILSRLAIFAGGFAQSLRTLGGLDTTNQVLDQINDAIERDLELQKAERENARKGLGETISAWGQIRALAKDDAEADAVYRKVIDDRINRDLEMLKTRATSADTVAGLEAAQVEAQRQSRARELDQILARNGIRQTAETRTQRVGRRVVRDKAAEKRRAAVEKEVLARRKEQRAAGRTSAEINQRALNQAATAAAARRAAGEKVDRAGERKMAAELAAVDRREAAVDELEEMIKDGLPFGAGPVQGQFADLALTPQGQAVLLKKKTQLLQRAGVIMTEVIKEASGTQVSDEERAFQMRIRGFRPDSTLEEFQEGIRGLRNELEGRRRGILAGAQRSSLEAVQQRQRELDARQLPGGAQQRGNVR